MFGRACGIRFASPLVFRMAGWLHLFRLRRTALNEYHRHLIWCDAGGGDGALFQYRTLPIENPLPTRMLLSDCWCYLICEDLPSHIK